MDKIKIERTWLQGSPVQVDNLMGNAFVGEAGAHEFLISGKDNAGNVVPITGTITGKFLSSTMTTFALSGYVAEGVASVTLPSECYGAPGQFVVSIFATNGSTTTCIYCGVGSIFRTSTAAIAYPTTTLPDLTLLINQLDDVIASFPADLTHLLGAIAPTFVDNLPFYAGQYVWNDQVLYRFTVDHPAGSWAGSADTVVAVIGTELNSTVRYTQQVLTDAQKTVARTNIDAADADDVTDLELTTVQVTPQTFDDNSKSQARSNIGAASSGDLSTLSTLVNNQGGYISDLNAVIGTVPTGETVEGQITDLKSAIDDVTEDIEFAVPTAEASNTNSGVTCEVQNDGRLKIYGTSTATRTYLFLNGQNSFAVNSTPFDKTLPAGSYSVEMSVSGSLETNVQFYYTYNTFSNGQVVVSKVVPTAKVTFTDPVMLGFRFSTNTDFGTSDNPTYITIHITQLNAVDRTARSRINDEILKTNGITNIYAKMLSFGNSILTGSVHVNGAMDHLAAYNNAPYGCIARALKIPQENVIHTLLDSTGIVHDAGQGSFLANIKATDISEYDYLLTHFWINDLADRAIGTIDDTAESITLAGAVVDLVNYIRTSNGLCQLILISAPPVSYNYTGRSVFTHVYAGGGNILELDVLMHKMAEKYHFIYIDWQSLALSYYYQNYTDGYNVHADNEETYRAMGDYLAANLRYAQSDIENRFNAEKAFGVDVLRENGTFQTGTHNGITFAWNADGTLCTVSGTATARANHNIYSEQKYLPKGIFPGDDMIVRFHSDSPDVYPRSIFWASGDVEISNTPMTMDIPIHVPENAIGWTIRLNVESGKDLTGDNIAHVDRIQAIKLHPKKMDVPLIVSFVDDDTSADQYVTRYHDNCCHNGVLGNYAVITKHLENGNTTLTTMLEYQDEGFGMLLHCYEQVPDGENYWTASPRTKAQTNMCRANLIKGLNYLRANGFVNYRHWITPGGHREDDLVAVAKELGLINLISTQNGRENTPQDCNKWFIKRVSLKHDDSSASMTLAKVKEYIDTTVAHGCGWLIIVTHFNEGWRHLTEDDAWDSTIDANGYPVGYPRFNEMVQYALSKGMTPMTIPQAWAYYEPILSANYAECTEGNNTRK